MKLLWGTPTNRGIHPEVVRNIVSFDLDSQKQKNDLILYFPQSSTLSLSRNLIVKEALKNDADWILMVDDDVQIKDNNFFNLMLQTAFDNDAPVVGLPCRLKSNEEIVFNFADKRPEGYENYKVIPEAPKEVDVIGTGCMLINMAWLREKWPKAPWFWVIDTETGSFPEDWNFCEQVKQRGGKIMVESRVKTTHWGSLGFTF